MRLSAKDAVRLGFISKKDLPKEVQTEMKKQSKDLEGEEQCEVVNQFRSLYPVEGHLLIHIPNGGSRKNKFEGWRLKQQGTRAGVSDLHLPIARGGYFGLWMEFKAAPPFDASIQNSQIQWLQEMRAQGYYAVLCKGPEAALKELIAYMSLPKTMPTQFPPEETGEIRIVS
ncbi:VRR-NUC domain-containing protein [Neptuniibacter sp. QD37_11]|uniref:VRR-NUC domain-containing protein n=1 Tax=Neptuniibacter sp. QD37_11 TaxID=3398209 RepID=UPI0039F4557F